VRKRSRGIERIGGSVGSGCKLVGPLSNDGNGAASKDGTGAMIGGGADAVAGLPACAKSSHPPKNPKILPAAIKALKYFWSRFILSPLSLAPLLHKAKGTLVLSTVISGPKTALAQLNAAIAVDANQAAPLQFRQERLVLLELRVSLVQFRLILLLTILVLRNQVLQMVDLCLRLRRGSVNGGGIARRIADGHGIWV
jgi:hypothetical protein